MPINTSNPGFLVPVRGFKLTVFDDAGRPLPGVSLRILDAQNNDQTSYLLLRPDPVTDMFGAVSRIFLVSNLPAGIYTAQLSKPGWQTKNLTLGTTVTPFFGKGDFTTEMYPDYVGGSVPGNSFAVSLPPKYVSAMFPIVTTIETTEGTPVDRLETTVYNFDGIESEIQNPIPFNSSASVDIHNRLYLDVLPFLVPEDEVTAVDPYFSTVARQRIKAVTSGYDVQINLDEGVDTYTVLAANMVPSGVVNDLSDFVQGPNAPQKWITYAKEPVLFYGYYFDLMIWLPKFPAVGYTLKTNSYNNAGIEIPALASSTPMFQDERVQRVKLDPAPEFKPNYVILQVLDGPNGISEQLKVNYKYGY